MHLHDARVTVDGGVVIDVTKVDRTSIDGWIDYYGPDGNDDGTITVYKQVDENLTAGHQWTPTTYAVGTKVKAADWQPTAECGNGLHFSPTPQHTFTYADYENPRFLECRVKAANFVALGDKIKAKSCVVVRELDQHGKPVQS
ncbi:DUF7666 domain-containing protein [Branchiibius hedensis]|uniref:DUF7666 domain-containing protein n=1 Tax=Branchiibius hedensis TaxID=672460 RepID=UPI003CCC8C54